MIDNDFLKDIDDPDLIAGLKAAGDILNFTSKLLFLKFSLLMNAGFTREEAIELCKGDRLYLDMKQPFLEMVE